MCSIIFSEDFFPGKGKFQSIELLNFNKLYNYFESIQPHSIVNVPGIYNLTKF